MNIKLGNIVTLNGKHKYLVAGKSSYNNIWYYYLIDINDSKNVKACKEIVKDNLTIMKEIHDLVIIKHLSKDFLLQSKDLLLNYKSDKK